MSLRVSLIPLAVAAASPKLPPRCVARVSRSAQQIPSYSDTCDLSLFGRELRANCRSFRQGVGSERRQNKVMAIAGAPVEVLVKAATGEPTVLGDCPFSQRVLLTLEEKKIPYDAKLVDTANKPDWFLEINPEGKVPVIKFEDKWIPDSDVIVGILEKNFPEPSLVAPEEASSVGSKVFPSFVKFLKSGDPNDDTESNLKTELKSLNDHLGKTTGPFISGEKITSVDIGLAPKLYHLKVVLKNFKNWTIPEEFGHVLAYIEVLSGLESFKKTAASEQVVINGWKRALGL